MSMIARPEGAAHRMRCCLLLSVVLLAGESAADERHGVGDRIENFTLEDQHGVAHSLDEPVAILLFSRDMEGGDVLKEALEETPPGFLAERQAVYVSDISGMPRLITRMFAIPSMRDRSYSVWLDRDGDATARLPTERGKATLIFCRDREITRVEHLAAPEDVRRVLGQTKSSPGESE